MKLKNLDSIFMSVYDDESPENPFWTDQVLNRQNVILTKVEELFKENIAMQIQLEDDLYEVVFESLKSGFHAGYIVAMKMIFAGIGGN